MIIKKQRYVLTPLNIYNTIWIVFLTNGATHLFGDTISVIILFALFIWSIYYFFRTVRYLQESLFLKIWTFVLVLFTVYGLLRMANLMGHVYKIGHSGRQFLIEHWTSMLPIYPYYYFAKNGLLKLKDMKVWALLSLPIAYVLYRQGAMAALIKFVDSPFEEFTNNAAYSVLAVLPLLFFWKNKPLIMYSSMIVIMILLLMAMKRGAIFIGVASMLLIFWWSLKESKGLIKKIATYGIVVAFVLLVVYYFNDMMSNSDYFVQRVDDTLSGNSSNRDKLYSFFISYFFTEMNIVQMLFGLGADGTILAYGNQAHNDWLELLIDMGLLGFVSFFVFWIVSWKEIRSDEYSKDIKQTMTLIVAMLLIRSLFSMSINDIYIFSTMCLGFCLANKGNNVKI